VQRQYQQGRAYEICGDNAMTEMDRIVAYDKAIQYFQESLSFHKEPAIRVVIGRVEYKKKHGPAMMAPS
jgi:hypothetical protein